LLWRDCLWQHAVVAVNRLKFAVAQLGRKAGARDALACLLGVEGLPGAGWRVLDERTWRTGVAGHATPWGGRARAAGSVTAWRSFQDAAGRRWVWVQVMPLVSAQDALDALGGIGDRLLGNARATVKVVREHDVEVVPFAGASAVWAHEQHTAGHDGEGVSLLLAGVVGVSVVVVCASGSAAWDWGAVSGLAARQAGHMAAGGSM
jgi:hypothetical protein